MPTLFSASLSAGRDAGGRLVAWFHAIPRRRRRSLDLERSAGVWIEVEVKLPESSYGYIATD